MDERVVTVDSFTCAPTGPDPRQAFGYLCLPRHVASGRIAILRWRMTTFAIREGWNITRWFIDDRDSHGASFVAMTAAVRRGEASRVIVPEAVHLRRSQDTVSQTEHADIGQQLGVDVHAVDDLAGELVSTVTLNRATSW